MVPAEASEIVILPSVPSVTVALLFTLQLHVEPPLQPAIVGVNSTDVSVAVAGQLLSDNASCPELPVPSTVQVGAQSVTAVPFKVILT